MSKIKTGALDQYAAGPFEQQQFGAAGVEGVNSESVRDTLSRSLSQIVSRVCLFKIGATVDDLK